MLGPHAVAMADAHTAKAAARKAGAAIAATGRRGVTVIMTPPGGPPSRTAQPAPLLRRSRLPGPLQNDPTPKPQAKADGVARGKVAAEVRARVAANAVAAGAAAEAVGAQGRDARVAHPRR